MADATSSRDRNAEWQKETELGNRDIRQRTFEFAVRVCRFVKYLRQNRISFFSIQDQLLRSGTSIAANLEEANAAETKRDFIHKNNIALKEARETVYWLKLISATEKFGKKIASSIAEIENEADEISKIVGKIIVNSKKNKLPNRKEVEDAQTRSRHI